MDGRAEPGRWRASARDGEVVARAASSPSEAATVKSPGAAGESHTSSFSQRQGAAVGSDEESHQCSRISSFAGISRMDPVNGEGLLYLHFSQMRPDCVVQDNVVFMLNTFHGQ